MPAVLLTGSRAPATLDLARRFAEEGWFVVVADSQASLTSASRAVGASYRVPSARFRPREFAAAVAGIARRHAVELIVPTCEETFWLAAARDDGLAAAAPLFAPPIEVLRRLHDKAAFAGLLADLGVAHPSTEVIASQIAWRRRAARRAAHPDAGLVLKPAFSRFGSRTRFVASGEPLPDVGRVTRDERWVVQEQLSGAEFCCSAVAVRGRLTAFAVYRPVWRAGVGAGVAFRRLDSATGPGAEARRIAARLASALCLTGQFGLDLMDTGTDVVVLECNPRTTSGLHLFGPRDGLAGAFAGADARGPSRDAVRLALPHAMYALPGMRRPTDVARWFRQLDTPDALRPRGDRIPIPALLRAVATQVRTSRRTGLSLAGASTYDIEWNGEAMLPALSGSADAGSGNSDGLSGVMKAFVAGVDAVGGTRRVVDNVDVALTTIAVGGEVLPVTVTRASTRGERAGRTATPPPSYVVSPLTHYVRYAREEVSELRSRSARGLARLVLGALDAVLRAGRIDDVAIIGNALLSTNLLPDPDERAIVDVTQRLVAAHPGRAIAWRSVHGRDHRLPETLRRIGYRLVPARSVLFTATRDAEWSTLRDVKRDRALFESSGYRVRHLDASATSGTVTASAIPERHRIAELYRQLYIAKYSRSNPQYTAEFIAQAAASGLLEFTVLERDGRIDGVFGFRVAHGLLAAPIVGYDVALPQEVGLYRILSYLIARTAHERQVDLHNSSGVADFKRNRGGEAELEYTAVLTRHLPLRQRTAWAVLEGVVTHVAVPMVTRAGL